MKKWIVYGIAFTSILFFVTNIILFLKSDQFSNLQIIDEFVKPIESDLVQSLEKPGVILSTTEEHIYLDTTIGSLGQIYVKEGDVVQFGDILFTYQNAEIGANEQILEGKVEQIELRSSQLEEEIDLLGSFILEIKAKEEMTDIDLQQIQQYEVQILQKNNQISELQLEKELQQHTLLTLQERQSELEVISPLSGYVKSISTNRSEPVLTIVSDSLIIKGELTEEEALDVSEGLAVQIMHHENNAMDGTLSQISNLPLKEPALDQETTYPFYVSFDEEEQLENINIGNRVLMEIIQEERINALIVPTNTIRLEADDDVVYVVQDGMIEKRIVEKGWELNEDVQITDGVNLDNLLVMNPSANIHDNPFVTKLQVRELEKDSFNSFRKKEILELLFQSFVR
ncbi:hypothetical protein JCM9140_3341 [Halalkalibacter wakoensis JCM 9140]|uniref:RND efflux pump membrane fusion protein barrel-sandwich domain-containing protein n=1 Tax=Halalkalibacter wakoensis JCM 9140 TaxID=1236970 RepID=W4Q673_9BACI|nr:HlyD family efflux transporter periplasmic adaptor subunit [Halalkalibacter wakoensis]GAE27213.1 hypothetical protein JCM9140_3341 [Halalkalibacter wakoensis JCM 9140]